MSKAPIQAFEKELFNPTRDEILNTLQEAISFINGTRNKVRLLDLNLFHEEWVNICLSMKEGAKWTNGGGIKGTGYGRFTSMAKSSILMIAWFTHRKIKKVIIKGGRYYLSSGGYALSPIARMTPYQLVFPDRWDKMIVLRETRVKNILVKIGILKKIHHTTSDLMNDIDDEGTFNYQRNFNDVFILATAPSMALVKHRWINNGTRYNNTLKDRRYGWLLIRLDSPMKDCKFKLPFKFVNPKSKFYQKYTSSERLAIAYQFFLENLLREGMLRKTLI